MEEKKVETKLEQPQEQKKVYTLPTLTVYGKLTELTAKVKSGSGENSTNRKFHKP